MRLPWRLWSLWRLWWRIRGRAGPARWGVRCAPIARYPVGMADRTTQPHPTPIQAAQQAAEQMRKWQAVRDRNIREARAQGASLRAVAAAVDLHHSTVRVIEAGTAPVTEAGS